MGKLLMGDKTYTPIITKTEEVAKTKYGATIDTFLGDVDADGNYVVPTEPVEINLAGVKSVPASGFEYKFFNVERLVVNANDVVSVCFQGFRYAFASSNVLANNAIYVSFDNLEVIDSNNAFEGALHGSGSFAGGNSVSFKKLKKIAADSVFDSFITRFAVNFDEVFPSLEEISGYRVLYGGFPEECNFTFSKIKKITGGSSASGCTFGRYYSSGMVWTFPRATEMIGYIWNIGSYSGEIHFAAANQAAIEACEGYDYKWGFTLATIYFDLVLSITVNGVVYDREHTIDGYTSWKDTDGNLVYTDATAEPAVGTVVYSDQGTTQVGTVSEAS